MCLRSVYVAFNIYTNWGKGYLISILIIKTNEIHSFSNLFDKVLYVSDRSTVRQQEYLNTVYMQ